MNTPYHLLSLDEKFEKSKKLKIVCMSVINYGHMIPMLRIADALLERGHELHIVSCGNTEGKKRIPKLYEGMDVTIHLPESPEQETIWEPVKNRQDPKHTFI